MLKKALKILEDKNMFITGSAGTGKSYLTREIIKEYKKDEKKVITLGSTGVSAVNIGGYTIHSFFGFGISGSLEELMRYDRKHKKKLGELKNILAKTDLIIIDEISMVGAILLDMILYRFRNMGYEKRVVFVGDFYQLPPIVKDEVNSLFTPVYAFESDSWKFFDLETLHLEKIYRTKDESFIRLLELVRRGEYTSYVGEYIEFLRGNFDVYSNEPTYLFGRNLEVDKMNNLRLEELEAKEIVIEAVVENKNKVHEKVLDRWVKSLSVPKDLSLKVGAPILFTINNWGSFYNGEKGVVKSIEDDFLMIEKNSKLYKVQRHTFKLTTLVIGDDLEEQTQATFEQFPVKLAYAITIHKSQGMSIENLVCNIDHIFTPSQFYVSISRATNPDKLKIDYSRGDIVSYIQRIIKTDERLKNI